MKRVLKEKRDRSCANLSLPCPYGDQTKEMGKNDVDFSLYI